MKKKEKIEKILNKLGISYGRDIPCYLDYNKDYELLIAVILSAQCTDQRVNAITKELFTHFTTLEAIAEADISRIEEYVRSAGLYHSKAKNIKATAIRLIEEFDGKVPDNMGDLTSLPGVGRKTANVILGNIYGIPSVVVDTHVKRVSYRLGLTKNTDPEKVEYDLMKELPKDHWIAWNMQIIALGRSICTARNPKCQECFLSDLCAKN